MCKGFSLYIERGDVMLEKTNRMNLLYDFYCALLTEKQRMILEYYFHDDYSLSEIAEQLNVSRQAVFEHIKRAEATLEELETKLGLIDKFEKRRKSIGDIQEQLSHISDLKLREGLVLRLEQLKELE
jgi:predicted DNA-binding protein YlxM (UPF0122 family)